MVATARAGGAVVAGIATYFGFSQLKASLGDMKQPANFFVVRAQSNGLEPVKFKSYQEKYDDKLRSSVDFVSGFPDCTPPKLAPVRSHKSIVLEFDMGRRLSRGC